MPLYIDPFAAERALSFEFEDEKTAEIEVGELTHLRRKCARLYRASAEHPHTVCRLTTADLAHVEELTPTNTLLDEAAVVAEIWEEIDTAGWEFPP